MPSEFDIFATTKTEVADIDTHRLSLAAPVGQINTQQCVSALGGYYRSGYGAAVRVGYTRPTDANKSVFNNRFLPPEIKYNKGSGLGTYLGRPAASVELPAVDLRLFYRRCTCTNTASHTHYQRANLAATFRERGVGTTANFGLLGIAFFADQSTHGPEMLLVTSCLTFVGLWVPPRTSLLLCATLQGTFDLGTGNGPFILEGRVSNGSCLQLADESSARRAGVIKADLERNQVIRQLAASTRTGTSPSMDPLGKTGSQVCGSQIRNLLSTLNKSPRRPPCQL
ncbi:hypothetical protein Bbelb_088520 [Branchiostoma belcheri]|nr:hypothetical protein Bbelb_088520 [Branchiostoma belcheri]